ncbi:AAA family ATPase [Haliangium sp.]|uniref:AAA family ATPase n=1 Tax=Haliangium sp. TaxID=2663208 RepID=UPI003D1412E8
MRFVSSITTSDFRILREDRQTYVDKTASIARALTAPQRVLLFPRPRRFGKTLWMSTFEAFVERRSDADPGEQEDERAALFGDLAIWRDEDARAHAGRYPVVSMTFKDIKSSTWERCLEGVNAVMADAFLAHDYLRPGLAGNKARIFDAVSDGTASQTQLAYSLVVLTEALHRYHGERVVLLIDEYDLPIHAAYSHGYYEEAIELFRNFLSGGCKDNSQLFKGILTGILRVAKESIFSGLNNLEVYSLLNPEYADSFGFTESEVEELARLAEAQEHLDTLRTWYNGYHFGDQVIYNPWSVLKFLGSRDKSPQAYWVQTGSDQIIRDLIERGGLGDLSEQEALLRGDEIEADVSEALSLRDVELQANAALSLLLFSGYLTATDVQYGDRYPRVRLRIPNREVATLYADIVLGWWETGLAARGGAARSRDVLDAFLTALLAGDGDRVERHLERLLIDHVSHHDLPRPAAELPYHMFVLGLLVHLAGDYDVRSNRESGYGRADVLLIPRRPGEPGVVIELKTIDPERDGTPEAALDRAMAQIDERDYAAELRARGAGPIRAYAAAFERKRAHVRVRSEP